MSRAAKPASMKYRVREQTPEEEDAFNTALDEFIEAFVRFRVKDVRRPASAPTERATDPTFEAPRVDPKST